jgi:restriction system protein
MTTSSKDSHSSRLDFLLPGRMHDRMNGEADWLPAPEEVERARRRLEQQGVVQSLHGSEARRLVPPGETPWLWWITAVLWLAIWPAVIVLTLTNDRLSWMPVWLPIALALIHMLALAVPVLYTERNSGKADLRRRFGRVGTIAEMLALEPAEFEAWTAMLFQLMGYRVSDTQAAADHGIDLAVSDDRLRLGLVQCKRYRGTVGEGTVRDLYGTMIHEDAGFAWLVTTGAVSRQAREWATGKPMELWDGKQLEAMAQRYR